MKHSKTNFIGTILAAGWLTLALTGCNKPAGENSSGGGAIKVGEFASLTGKEATFGMSSHEGTLLAVEAFNAAGGVLGIQLELLSEDARLKADGLEQHAQ